MADTQILDFKLPEWAGEEDINMFRDAAYKFYSNEMAPHSESFRKNKKGDREYWNKAGEMGLLCVSMPEEYGGMGGDYRHEMIVQEELVKAGVDGFGLSLHNAIVAPYILHYGTEEQKKKYLPKMATGEFVGAIAMTEPGTGSDLQGVASTPNRSSCWRRTRSKASAAAASSTRSATTRRTRLSCSSTTLSSPPTHCSVRKKAWASSS